MARNTVDPLLKLEEQLTCPVCLEPYKNPKNLPCLHNFCQDCLGPCPLELREGTYFLKCPTCRKPAQLPEGGVPALPTAFIISSLFELHQTMLAKQDEIQCPQHKKPLEAFCDTCQKLVCVVCITRSHNHCAQMNADIIHDCKQQLEEGLQSVKKQIATVMDAIKDLNTCDEAIVRQGEAVKQLIYLQAQEARAELDQAERKLIQEVRIAVQQKRGVIALQKQEAQNELAQLQSSIEVAEQNMKVQSDQQIVTSKTKILDRIKASVSRAQKSKLKPVERVDIRYEENQKVVEQCKRLGMLTHTHLSQNCHLTLQPILPGRKAHCQLSTRGNPISTKLISCRLIASNGPQPADCTITETGPCTFEINYTPVMHSPHHLRVMVGGSDIPGSVFSVPVLPPSPESRGQPLHIIQELDRPTFVSVGGRGHVIISERQANCITIFSRELQRITSVESLGIGTNHFSGPAGTAITDDDRILVADWGNHCIRVLTMEGRLLASVGTKGKGPLQFEFPACIIIHPNGQVLVSETDSNRIQVLNKDLTFSHSFYTHGLPRGEGEGHHGMAVDSQGVVYITDTRDGRVQKFSISGQFIAQFGSMGLSEGYLRSPWCVAIDDKDYVYVSEPVIQTILVLTTSGKFVQYFETNVEDENSDGEDENLDGEEKCLPGIFGLAIDKNGNLYASNPKEDQVMIF